MKKVLYIGGAEMLARIEPLWCGLRDHQASKSEHFRLQISHMDFSSRMEELQEKSAGGHILVQIISLQDGGRERDVAYCVSTVTLDGIAEIDSIFVAKECRGKGLGDEMMRQALSWIDEHDTKELRTTVTYGNEEVLPFYAKYGLLPRKILLRKNG